MLRFWEVFYHQDPVALRELCVGEWGAGWLLVDRATLAGSDARYLSDLIRRMTGCPAYLDSTDLVNPNAKPLTLTYPNPSPKPPNPTPQKTKRRAPLPPTHSIPLAYDDASPSLT